MGTALPAPDTAEPWSVLGELPAPIGEPGFGLPDSGALQRFDVTEAEHAAALAPYGLDLAVEGGLDQASAATVWLDPALCRRKLRIVLRPGAAEARIVLADRHGLSGTITVAGRRAVIVDGGSPHKHSAVWLTFWSDDCLFFWGRHASSNGLVTELMGDGRQLIFGEDCMLATDVMVRPSDMHAIFSLDDLAILNRSSTGKVVVHPHVWLGQRCMILKDVEIGAGSVIASCSVVTQSVPARSLAVGSPARVIRHNVSWRREHAPTPHQLAQTRSLLAGYGPPPPASAGE